MSKDRREEGKIYYEKHKNDPNFKDDIDLLDKAKKYLNK